MHVLSRVFVVIGVLGSVALPAEAADGPVTAVVRPEKIAFLPPAPDRLTGKVAMRVFQGNHWLYRVETAAGSALVIRQNTGEPGPAEGETVGLHWQAEDMVVRPRREEPA